MKDSGCFKRQVRSGMEAAFMIEKKNSSKHMLVYIRQYVLLTKKH